MRHVCASDVEEHADVVVVEGVVHVSSVLAVADEPLGAQEPEVVRARGLREACHVGQIADAQLAGFEERGDQAEAARVGEQPERLGKVERHAFRECGSCSRQVQWTGTLCVARLGRRGKRYLRYLHNREDISASPNLDSRLRMSTEITSRRLGAHELARLAEIDRTEQIDAIYLQRGSGLELVEGDRSAPAWDQEGTGMHSVAMLRAMLEDWMRRGATALGALHCDRLVGIGGILPHLRPGMAQLVFLYVSDGYRGRGIGGRLSGELDEIAGAAGDTSVVVSATPSVNTVRFYLGQGYEPMEEPVPELYELEPEDIHMWKSL